MRTIDPDDNTPPPASPARRTYPEDVPRLADLHLEIVAINDQLIGQLRRTNRALGALSEQARELEERWAKRDKRAA